ncbi:MAG: hypothetical protein Roseis2KO_03600 [Roseivirga sp.]
MKHSHRTVLKVATTLFLALFTMAVVYKDNNPLYTYGKSGQSSTGIKLELKNCAPPNTNVSAQPDFDILAWNSFIALNWPAVMPDEDNGYLRGIPDISKSFTNAQPGDLLVWETFKEKREIFNQVDSNGNPALDPWNAPVNYGPLRGADIDNTGAIVLAKDKTARVFHQSGKQFASFNGLDETAEVGSEALELFYPNGRFNPILGRPVGPRVWRGLPSDGNPVRYEVKLNYDYYNYIDKNNLYTNNTAKIAKMASDAKITLPFRTSAAKGAGGPNPNKVLNYSNDQVQKDFKTIYKNRSDKTDPTPPLQGAMQFKAAWVEISEAEKYQYHYSEATYYVTENDSVKPKTALFGLAGLHIIQRIHTGASGQAKGSPQGGTFIFATWEHTSLRSGALYTYSNYYNPVVDPAAGIGQVHPEGFYPPINIGDQNNNGVYRVMAKYPIISNPGNTVAPGTAEVNKMVHDKLPTNSVWRNYQLVGTQFMAIDVQSSSAVLNTNYPVNQNDPLGIGQPTYLANLVIETNEGLQHFQGQPPGTNVIGQYSKLKSNTSAHFNRTNDNTYFNGNPYNMGGCMGCHGVVQSKGFSFSFVLAGGREGAKTDTETNFDIPPLKPIIRKEK